MLHHSRFIITLTTLALIATGSIYAQETPQLLKDSFEEGKTAPDGWKRGANLQGVRYIYDRGRGNTGQRSLCLQKTAKRYFPIAQWSRILPLTGQPKSLKVSCQIRAEKVTKAIVDVVFLDKNQKRISHKWASYIGEKQAGDKPVQHNWKEYSGVVSVPEKTAQFEMALQIYGPGKVWFDDLEVTVVKSNTSATNKPAIQKDKNEIEIKVGKGIGRYLLISPDTKQAASKERALLLVLPGGDGSGSFHPFVKRIYENSLSEDFVLAQPIAKMWTQSQKIIWPTTNSKIDSMNYTTEELVGAVIKDVSQKTKIDPSRIYLLAWSSGGPAAYATLLQKQTTVSGAFIAMSVFKPNQLPDLSNAKHRSIYILHSPQDKVCPYPMAKAARDSLSKANVRTTLVEYQGGHGWKGNVYTNIRQGIDWLEKTKAP
ncbi:hypothetical protein [uncultured Gimesia sp.]|uniref:alpha/beta hydrolase n=1 Tax=uncultured Gimesia sp. TaxID=1678688 RepID=UPI00262FB956|nr:hypothetical protein [uncultured Gimesia sp.]